MSLFDVPHKATVDGKPVLWFGTEALEESVVAIVAGPGGRLGVVPLNSVVADVRHVTERDGILEGRSGPGWIDLEDLEAAGTSTSVVEMLGGEKVALQPSGPDYLTDKEGNRYDPKTGQALDEPEQES